MSRLETEVGNFQIFVEELEKKQRIISKRNREIIEQQKKLKKELEEYNNDSSKDWYR